jgi:lipoprotein NlpI
VHLLLYIAQARAGDMEAATAGLETYAEEHPGHDWPRPIIDLFLGRGSPEAVERAAAVADRKDVAAQRFDADFYIGQWALIAGDEAVAAQRLKAVYDSRMREYLEFDIARADLTSLDSLAGSPTPATPPRKNVPTGSRR